MSLKKKVVWLPYDFDTAIGINNDGQLVFDYQLEDIDYQRSGAPIFNGQDSVIWKNIRAAFGDELKTMYQNLRSSGALSYEKIEQMFEEHQSKWSESIFNEDSQFKYIEPFIKQNANYLYMLLGSKEQQRKWWLYNRFRYIDSKYIAGEARSDSIFLRPYAADNITITPYADIYATIAWDATITQKRAERNIPITLNCPYETMNGNIVTIYSSSQLASIGDLSGLQIGQIDISNATRLQALKIGSSASGYDNSNLYSLTFGNNVLLKSVDVRNCSGLGDTSLQGHTQTTVDLSGCSILEEVYFQGTKVQGITLPNGGVLKVLHLPSTITNLTILNQTALTDLSVPSYSNISTLRLENIPIVDTKMVINNIPANTRVRLIGFTWEVTDAEEIEAILDRLDTMRGLDESGGNMDKAQVSGTIKVATLAGSQIASYKERYPYITIDAESVSSTVTYKTYDGSSIITTETVVKDAAHPAPDATYSGKPSRTSTAQYSYTFAGWSTSPNGPAEANAQKNIQGDRILYAAYTATVRTYNVYFYNGSTLLQTVQNVPYGGSARYTGTTPVNPQDSTLDFIGWNPAPTNIVGNTSCYAQFESPIQEIEDSWTQIGNAIDNGSYKTKYKVGWYKPLNLGNQGIINMQIVAMDEDVLTAGGTAPLTFIGMELLNTSRRMNATDTNKNGWAEAQIRKTYLPNTILPLINSAVRMRIQEVNKTYYDKTTGFTLISSDKLWIPSAREFFVGTNYEDSGVIYSNIYKNNDSRKKHKANSTSNTYYWSRSALSSSDTNFRNMSIDGYVSGSSASDARGVCVGFCLGSSSEINDTEITDSWDTIIQNIDNKTYQKYDIGQYKPLDLGTQGIINMQLVAVDEDVTPNGDAIPLTFIGKELLNTSHLMNATNTNVDGWAATGMRTYLKNTIKPLIPSNIIKRIWTVNKTYWNRTSRSTLISEDKLWIPSAREICGGTSYEDSGVIYSNIFRDNASRMKHKANFTSSNIYQLRSAYSSSDASFYRVNENGSVGYGSANSAFGVCLGFCLGYEQQTIEDDWSTILSQSNPSSKYSLGDTKSLSINGTDHLMQIVAFNSDEMTAGGTAKITWVEKDLFTTHRMNPTDTNANGWAETQMRSWLRETILPTIPEIVKNKIVEVNKTYYDNTTSSTLTQADTIWIPSAREIFGGSNYEDSGVIYSNIFRDNASRMKHKAYTSNNIYWLRSACNFSSYFRSVYVGGQIDYYRTTQVLGVCVAFCTN